MHTKFLSYHLRPSSEHTYILNDPKWVNNSSVINMETKKPWVNDLPLSQSYLIVIISRLFGLGISFRSSFTVHFCSHLVQGRTLFNGANLRYPGTRFVWAMILCCEALHVTRRRELDRTRRKVFIISENFSLQQTSWIGALFIQDYRLVLVFEVLTTE